MSKLNTFRYNANTIHAVTGSSSGLLLNMVSLWFEAVEVTEAEVVAEEVAEAELASGCGCCPGLLLVKLAAVCCKLVNSASTSDEAVEDDLRLQEVE